MLKREGFSFVIYALVCGILLSSLVVITDSTSAMVVWSDDFNDGNYDGWTVTYGSFSLANNCLLAMEASSAINHPSTVTEGTWSFDLHSSGLTSSGVHLSFYCEDFVFYPKTGFDLKVGRNAFELMYWEDYYDIVLGAYYPTSHIMGWHHVDVTRDATGLMRVFINGTLRIEVANTPTITSNYFHFFCGPDEGIDNVVVSDSIDITPTPGTPEVPTMPSIPGFPIAAIVTGIGVTIGLILLSRRRR